MKTQIVKDGSKQPKTWIKIPKMASLYRWGTDGFFYVRGTVNGKYISEKLETKDLATAKRMCLEVKEAKKRLISGSGNITMIRMIEEYRDSRNGKNLKTNQSVINKLKKTPELGNKPINKVKGIEIANWFKFINLEAQNNNIFSQTIKASFEYAINQRYITSSPMIGLGLRKKYVRKTPIAPSVEQFEEIRKVIRNNKLGGWAEKSWELFSFCGLFGCYEAEARHLDWSHFNWQQNKINLVRQKTGVNYTSPIYPFAKDFINTLWENRDKPTSGKVFRISSAKQSISHACDVLGYHHFTIINFRQMFACRLYLAGVSVKNCSRWLGHSDGGTQFLELYSEVVSSMNTALDESDLAKLR